MKNYYSTLKAKLPVVAGITLLAFLASCSSSNQFASSFGKRKYTKGYYFDNVASVKTADKQVTVNTDKSTTSSISEKQTETVSQATVVAQAPTVEKQASPITRSVAVAPKVKHENSIAPVIASNNITSAPEVSSYAPESVASYHGGDSGHHYGRTALYCFLIALLLSIIAAVTVLVFLDFIAGIFWIAGIVFMILWLIN